MGRQGKAAAKSLEESHLSQSHSTPVTPARSRPSWAPWCRFCGVMDLARRFVFLLGFVFVGVLVIVFGSDLITADVLALFRFW